MSRNNRILIVVVLALLLSGCRPVVAQSEIEQTEQIALDVVNQYFEAYNAYDMDKMMAIHTEDAVWTWIDQGKNFPEFGPEGKLIGAGKDQIAAMFKADRGDGGFTGYILWSAVHGNTVNTIELWDNEFARQVDVPLIVKGTYEVSDGRIATLIWDVSPESSKRIMEASNK